jgi:hypothetical protein
VIGLAWSTERRRPPALDAFLACVTLTCEGLAVPLDDVAA